MTDAPRNPRRQRERWGRRAESVAAWWLRLKGYRVLARRVRTPLGEIDLVVARGRTLVLIEVKARATLTLAHESLSAANRRRLRRAGALVAAQWPGTWLKYRFDVVLVAPRRFPRHLVGVEL